jgi:hypothetical protein
MKKVLVALLALPLLTGVAMAKQQPLQLTNAQMDNVTAGWYGWYLWEIDPGSTSWTEVSVNSGSLDPCSSCYLNVSSPGLSVESKFGP